MPEDLRLNALGRAGAHLDVHCTRCGHRGEVSADELLAMPDRDLLDMRPRCQRCGQRAANVYIAPAAYRARQAEALARQPIVSEPPPSKRRLNTLDWFVKGMAIGAGQVLDRLKVRDPLEYERVTGERILPAPVRAEAIRRRPRSAA